MATIAETDWLFSLGFKKIRLQSPQLSLHQLSMCLVWLIGSYFDHRLILPEHYHSYNRNGLGFVHPDLQH